MNTFPMLPTTARQAIKIRRANLDHSALSVTGRTSSNVVDAFVVAASAKAVANKCPAVVLSAPFPSADDDVVGPSPDPLLLLVIVSIRCEPMVVATAAAAADVAEVAVMMSDVAFVAAATIAEEFIAIVIRFSRMDL